MPLKLHLRCATAVTDRDDLISRTPRQSLPVVNWLQWCLVLQRHFWPITSCHVVTTLGANRYGKNAAGGIPAARSVPIPAPLGRPAFGPAPSAVGRTQMTPLNLG